MRCIKIRLRMLVLSLLVSSFVMAPAASFAAQKEIINRSNEKKYILPDDKLDFKADLSNGSQGNAGGKPDEFLQKDSSGLYYNPLTKDQQMNAAIVQWLSSNSVNMSDVSAILSFISSNSGQLAQIMNDVDSSVSKEAVNTDGYAGPGEEEPFGVIDIY